MTYPHRWPPPRWALSLLLVLVADTLASPPALTPERAAALQEHVDAGGLAFEARRYEEALARYATALEIAPVPDLLWNIARCHEELGHLDEAVATFEQYRAQDVSPADRTAATEKLALLSHRMAERDKGTLVLRTGRADAQVTVNGRPMGRGTEVEARLDPGTHGVRVEAPGLAPWEAQIALGKGERVERQVELRPSPPEPPVAGSVVVVCEAPGAVVDLPDGGVARPGLPIELPAGEVDLVVRAPGYASVRLKATVVAGRREALRVELAAVAQPPPEAPAAGLWRWVTLGTGLAAVAAAGVLHGLAASDYERVSGAATVDGITVGITQAEAAAAQDAGDTKLIAAQSLYGAGGAVLATSVVLFILGE
ncbi:MAG: hypothetical protein AMXMBFR64_14820 [Myxococcales bacterium]